MAEDENLEREIREMHVEAGIALYQATDGPLIAAELFRQCLAGRYLQDIQTLIHPDSEVDVSSLDLRFLDEPDWGFSYKPRETPEGDAIVRLLHIADVGEGVIINKPTTAPSVDFIMRGAPGEWKLMCVDLHLGDYGLSS